MSTISQICGTPGCYRDVTDGGIFCSVCREKTGEESISVFVAISAYQAAKAWRAGWKHLKDTGGTCDPRRCFACILDAIIKGEEPDGL